MLRNSVKLAQRRLYDFLNTWSGCCVIIIGVFWVLNSALYAAPKPCSYLRGGNIHCSFTDFSDNIGHLYLEQYLTYEPMDAVYTWVNGSDPKWQRRKQLAQTHHNTTANTTDDTISINRFRDREELRYSLRSLEKYAPWIRRIFLVTDNQIPYWLNMHSSRISVITHDQIFPNKSHLPVFSSPAIESHLHRIPGLSKRFIYFNDDVFLGAPVHPEDFVSVSGLQKLYLSWDVPKCAPGCVESWIGDGYCDKACNVSDCNFDFPDCINGTNAATKGASRAAAAAAKSSFCASGCPENWLADKVCDNRCKNKECGWDMGDCGVQLLVEDFAGVVMNETNTIISSYSAHGNMTIPPALCDLPVLATVQKGANLVYIRLNTMYCHSKQGACDSSVEVHNFTYSTAEYTPYVMRDGYCPVVDNDFIQTASLLSKHNMLALLLQTDSMPVESLPARVAVYISAHNSVTSRNVSAAFAVEVVASTEEYVSGVPEGMGEITGFAGSCSIVSDEAPVLALENVKLLPDPFRMPHAGEEGVALALSFAPVDLEVANIPLSAITARIALTLPNGTSVSTSLPLCDVIGSIHFATHLIGRAYYDTSLCGKRMLGQLMYPSGRLSITLEPKDIVLMVRVPWKWKETPVTWIHGRMTLEIDITAQKKVNVTSPVAGVAVCTATSFQYGGYVAPAVLPLNVSNVTGEIPIDLQNGYRGRRLHSTLVNPPQSSFLSHLYTTSINTMTGYLYSFFLLPEQHGRRLLDTYGASLRHVNRLYSKEFGTDHRKVPAHMPHMINRDYIVEMQEKWPEEWEATSSHAFRSPTDMQYSFSYYYYLMNRNKAKTPDVMKYLANEVDTDFDGYINDNEFLTLASLVYGNGPTDVQLQELRENCTANVTVPSTHHHRTSYADVVIDETVSVRAFPTLQDISNCTMAVEGLLKNVQWPSFHSLGTEKDIAFEMIGDNYTIALAQLNSIRARKTKFVCVNDNMQEVNPQLDEALAAFYTSFFPYPSQFELPAGERNPTLYVDEYRMRYDTAVSTTTWRQVKNMGGLLRDSIKNGLIWISLWFIEKLQPDTTQNIAQSYRHSKLGRDGVVLPYHVLFFSSVGVIGVLLLRMSVRQRRRFNNISSQLSTTQDLDGVPPVSPSKIPRKGKVEGWFGGSTVDDIDEGQYESADYLGPRLPSPPPPVPKSRAPSRRNSGGNLEKKTGGDEDFLNTLWRSAGFGKTDPLPQRSKSTDDVDDDMSVSTLGMGGIEDYTPTVSYGLDDIVVNRRHSSAEPLASAMRRGGTTSGAKKSVHWSSNEYGMGSSSHPSGEDSSSSYSVGGMAKYLTKGIKGKVESIKRGLSLSSTSKSDEF